MQTRYGEGVWLCQLELFHLYALPIVGLAVNSRGGFLVVSLRLSFQFWWMAAPLVSLQALGVCDKVTCYLRSYSLLSWRLLVVYYLQLVTCISFKDFQLVVHRRFSSPSDTFFLRMIHSYSVGLIRISFGTLMYLSGFKLSRVLRLIWGNLNLFLWGKWLMWRT